LELGVGGRQIRLQAESKRKLTIEGITLPAERRAYMRDERLAPIHDRLMVSIDLSDISFS
jgi:hypothetical protein